MARKSGGGDVLDAGALSAAEPVREDQAQDAGGEAAPAGAGISPAAPSYVVAEGGPRNGAQVSYVEQELIDPNTGADVALDEVAEGQKVGVYTAEDLAHGPLMRWHGWQVVKTAAETQGGGT